MFFEKSLQFVALLVITPVSLVHLEGVVHGAEQVLALRPRGSSIV